MLSSVLGSEVAIQVNIRIMRAFIQMRERMLSHQELWNELDWFRRQLKGHEEKIDRIFLRP